MTRLQATQCRRITALLVPADDARPVRLLQVEDRSRTFSEVIGGGLLEETAAQLPDGQVVALYLDEDRVSDDLPANPRAARLASHLRLYQRMPVELRGDLLVTGLDAAHADVNVPPAVVTAARRAGLIAEA